MWCVESASRSSTTHQDVEDLGHKRVLRSAIQAVTMVVCSMCGCFYCGKDVTEYVAQVHFECIRERARRIGDNICVRCGDAGVVYSGWGATYHCASCDIHAPFKGYPGGS